MNTTEHTELGNALRFEGWDTLQGNPYITFDKNGTLSLTLQGLNDQGLPEPLRLILSAGVIIAMSGDYFGGKEVSYKLPRIDAFKTAFSDDSITACQKLGRHLIHQAITEREEQTLLRAYKKLANPRVTQRDIDTIYTINNSNYIPFSSTLNFYAQQLMFALRVKNYGEILLRNESHFTPWSVRVYVIGHCIALHYAEMYYEIKQCLRHSHYESDNPAFHSLRPMIVSMSPEQLQDLAHRYQALALSTELFCFHYYTDHFAAGHLSFMGDLRALLPKRFGVWGNILANALHDELNAITVRTKKAYKPLLEKDSSVQTGGDGDFDEPNNALNKQACLNGMAASLNDLNRVFLGAKRPSQEQYGGLKWMPDIDSHSHQPTPLLLLGAEKKIYYRTDLNHIPLLSPSELKAMYAEPLRHGFSELNSKLKSFWLVLKLRVIPFAYNSQLERPTVAEDTVLEQEQNPMSQLILFSKPIPVCQQTDKASLLVGSLPRHGFFSAYEDKSGQEEVQESPCALSAEI